jgi:phage terminase Nu1 subunit (DNA packaging protein)
MATVGVTQVASALNLSAARVQMLVKVGMPRKARGQYDPVKCMLWYVRYLQRALEKKSVPTLEGGYAGEHEERVRVLRAKADLREMELAKERSQLVAIQDVEEAFTDLIVTSKARMMAVPPRVAPLLLGLTSRVMADAIVEKALKEALHELANLPPKMHAKT